MTTCYKTHKLAWISRSINLVQWSEDFCRRAREET